MTKQGYSVIECKKQLYIASCFLLGFSVMMMTSLKSNFKLTKLKAPTVRVGLLRSRIKTIVASPSLIVNSKRG